MKGTVDMDDGSTEVILTAVIKSLLKSIPLATGASPERRRRGSRKHLPKLGPADIEDASGSPTEDEVLQEVTLHAAEGELGVRRPLSLGIFTDIVTEE
jgi:hypothetical protein